MNEYAGKGSKILLTGKMMNNNYEKNGETVYSNDIQVESIEIINSKKENNILEEDFADVLEIDDNLLD